MGRFRWWQSVTVLIGVFGMIAGQDARYYTAGVVEFSSAPSSVTETPQQATQARLNQYMNIINSPEADATDVLVFPESTLNNRNTASFVPHPERLVAPCNNLLYEPVVRDISCLARNRKKYIVINLTEKARCPEGSDTRPCAPNGLYHFNTNVAFDRSGTVVSRYRKYNLFGEAGINTTVYPETASFHTDFGVTFGHFICFDMMFSQPALQLVQQGVTDFIFPTMWFSELPFLTASQIQQAWAYSNNVNLLAAGASFPAIGSTGTGIYAGRRGTIVTVMNHDPQTKLYVAQVPKVEYPEAPITKQVITKYTPSEMTKLFLKRDQIDHYVTVDLPMVSNANFNRTVCHEDICCDFIINYSVQTPQQSQNFYRYKLAAFNGMRTFDGFADGTITNCAILACAGDQYDTCSRRFVQTDVLTEAVTFNAIEIRADFIDNFDLFILPNSVDISILPIEVEQTEYTVQQIAGTTPRRLVTYKLTRPRSDIYTFAIWGREFSMMMAGAENVRAALVLPLTVLAMALRWVL